MAKSFSLIIQNFFVDNKIEMKLPLNNELSINERIQINSNIFYKSPLKFSQNIIRGGYYQYLFLKEENTSSYLIEKFRILKDGIDNIFYNDEIKKNHIDTFSKLQQVYRGMCKLAFLYKFKKAKTQVSTDLYMNELDSNARGVFTLFDANNKYLFTLTDLVNIFYSSLCNSPYFIPAPIACKNPYNNTPFTKANLYNIYFFISFNKIRVPDIIQNFFFCNFNLRRFHNENKYIIHDYAITRYVNNSPVAYLRSSILEMIFEHNIYKKKIKIHADFPANRLIDIMRPYLLLYYKSKFSCRRCINRKYNKLLTMKMKEFITYNHKFGRKIKKNINTNDSVTDMFSFNDKHLKYKVQNEEYNNFNISHLSIDVVNAETLSVESSGMESSEDELDDSDEEDL